MKYFNVYSRSDVMAYTKMRRFVTRVGECVHVAEDKNNIAQSIENSTSPYVLFGIPEDIGIRANMGLGGADTAWEPFLSAFLNIQSNDFFSGDEVLMLGHFDFKEMKMLIEQNAADVEEKSDAYRHAVVTIDDAVEQLARIITNAGKIPIAIGGGHNNAYPLIKGTSKGLHKLGRIPLAQINCINLDAHTDFRPVEGRHSGNGFRYAEEDGYLLKYFVLGLHENHTPQNVYLDIMNNPFIDFISYEDIFIREKRNFAQALAHAVDFVSDNYTGIELDLDCVENVLSSAITPSGISVLHARQYLSYTSDKCKVAYLHICEGASQLEDGRRSETTGKLIGYFVTDFIKGA
ncbi:MAG: formimidoylglutamase [Chitinophagaceae bacterium]|nr:formimidoylglutamase [Chitinophagaceae bacterium]